MKKIILALFTILISFSAIAQTTDVVTGITNLNRLLLDGNTLYYTTNNAVFKIDISETTPTPQQVISGLSNPLGMALDGNTLYIAEFNAARISTIDVTDTNPTRLDFITGLNTPNYLLLNGNFLYYSDNNSNIVQRIDISATVPVTELVASGVINIDPIGLAIQGNILYMSQTQVNRVSSVDVTDSNTQPTDVVLMVNAPLGINIDGDFLYIVERLDNKISVKDLSDSGSFATDVITGLNNPLDLAINESSIFIIERNANKISKFERPLGVDDFSKNTIRISPNPAEDFIEIAKLSETITYKIYNILGEQMTNGSISPLEKLDISDLSSGIYLLQLSGKEAVKFIKI